MRRRLRLSLTARLTAYFSCCSAAVLLGLGIVIALAMERHFAVEDFTALYENVNVIRKVAESSSPDDVRGRIRDALQHRTDFVARIQSADGQIVYESRGFDFRPGLAAAARARRGETLVWHQDDAQYRGLLATVALAGESPASLSVLVGLNTDIHAHFLTGFRGTLAFYIAIAALASGVFGWWAARRGLSPLRTIASRAKTVTSNRLDERMPVDTVPVEVADLAATLNAMLERLENDFRRLSEFSTDIAHELRTPITNLLTQTEVVLSQHREAAKYREVLTSNAEELQRLARMVSDMLYLAKMENHLALPCAEDISVRDEIAALFDFYDALAEHKGVRLELRGEGHIVGDRLMFRRAFSNLLSNAIRHTSPGGNVIVTITPQAQDVKVTVDNEGEGIQEDQMPFIFERFFRADKSRARPEAESAGLGLAITKAIVVAHGGSIGVSRHGDFTRFGVQFPLAPNGPAPGK